MRQVIEERVCDRSNEKGQQETEGLAADDDDGHGAAAAGSGPTAALIPDAFRDEALKGLRRIGVEPFTGQDYAELEQVRQFILTVNPPGSITFE